MGATTDELLPPLLAHVLRFAPGDRVHTPFGPGVVVSPSDRQHHVEVTLAFGATLFARRGCLVPEFNMLACGEMPKDTRVLCLPETPEEGHEHGQQVPSPAVGTVRGYLLRDQLYEVMIDADDRGSVVTMPVERLRFAPTTRVRTRFCLGYVDDYRPTTDSYSVRLDFGGTGYFVAADVTAVDLRLLAKVPRPMSADAIYAEFQGRISPEDAAQLHEKAVQTYRMVQKLCEDHADTISFLSTNATYGDQYSKLLSSVLDPTLTDATARIRAAGATEIEKLKDLAVSAKQSLEQELLDGKDVTVFVAQATKVLSNLKNCEEVKNLTANLKSKANIELDLAAQKMDKEDTRRQRLVISQVLQAIEEKAEAHKPALEMVKNSLDRENLMSTLQKHETDLVKAQETLIHIEKIASKSLGVASITSLDPCELVTKAEEYLPKISEKAALLKMSGEQYLNQLQQTSQGQSIILQAKQLVQSVDNPEAFCENVQKAISEVQLDKIAEWGSTITTNRQKRQEFVDRVKDHCLDFFMSVLPTIKVDTISGIEEGVEYSLSNLDLSNFRVKKERVKVRMGTVADEELFTVRATHLTALLKGFQWTFAQKYFPYAHGGGLADAELSGGVIALGFKAEKKVVNKETGEFKPTLVLNSMEIEIRQELKLTVQGSWFSAIYNLLTAAFAQLIRDYLAKTMESKLLRHMIKLLTTLNDHMEKYWPLVFQLLDIRVEDLPSASPWRGAKEIDIQPHEIDCVFRSRKSIPFAFAKGVLNRYVVVSRIDDLESAGVENPDLLRVPVGASVLAINGLACNKLTLDEFKSLLETLPVPYTLRFSLFPEDTTSNRQQRVVSRPQLFSVAFKEEGPFGLRLRNRPLAHCGAIVLGFADSSQDGRKSAAERSGKIQPGHILTKVNDVDLRFKQLPQILEILKETKRRPAVLHFASSPDGIVKLREWPPMVEWEQSDEEAADGRNYVVISAFTRVPSFAQKSRLVDRGDILWKINDTIMISPYQKSFTGIMDALQGFADNGVTMRATFVTRDEFVTKMKTFLNNPTATQNQSSDPPKNVTDSETAESTVTESDGELTFDVQKEIVFEKPPLGILFGNWKDQAAYIRLFISSAGPAERSNIINIGQAVLQICGKNVPVDATPATIDQMIHEASTSDSTPPFSITLRDLDMEREIMKTQG